MQDGPGFPLVFIQFVTGNSYVIVMSEAFTTHVIHLGKWRVIADGLLIVFLNNLRSSFFVSGLSNHLEGIFHLELR